MVDCGDEFFYKNVIDTSSYDESDDDLLMEAVLLIHKHNVAQIPMYRVPSRDTRRLWIAKENGSTTCSSMTTSTTTRHCSGCKCFAAIFGCPDLFNRIMDGLIAKCGMLSTCGRMLTTML
jgi:hypothetical protein